MYESGENYLETILMLHQKQGYVRSIDIANELGFTKPSVSRAMSILKNDGYIVVESSGNIVLTEKGSKKANEVYERHLYYKVPAKNIEYPRGTCRTRRLPYRTHYQSRNI